MNLSALYSELRKIGIPDNDIFIHGLYGSTNDNEKLSLSMRMEKYSKVWEVYYKERGKKHSVREFNSESEACEYYLNQMKE